MSKYERAKEIVQQWKERCESLEEENSELEAEVERLKKFINTLPDTETFEKNRETIKQLRKKIAEQEEINRDKINSLTRDKMLLEGRIQHLEDSRKDLQERYAELKQDLREYQKK